ncbi:hypothetical protein M513_12917 [Trichuris suis]|uniref:Uncharacterized protein n=1 Tax=Trichuris suis TaxID=68888 RepID=A0A085LMM1_9BILA|nr:hypothetical protein M513_12917 [Trichuris suis]
MEKFDGDPKKWPAFIATFRALVHDVLPSDAQRLAVLGQLLSPKLRSGFAGYLADPNMYYELLRRLRRIYGDQHALAKASLAEIMSLAPLKSERVSELEDFFHRVSAAVSTMKLSGLHHDLNSSGLLEHVTAKLTPRLYEQWVLHSSQLTSAANFETWIGSLENVLRLKLLTATRQNLVRASSSPTERRPSLATRNVAISPGESCAICGDTHHRPSACPIFGSLPIAPQLVIYLLRSDLSKSAGRPSVSLYQNKDTERRIALRILFVRKEVARRLIIDGCTEPLGLQGPCDRQQWRLKPWRPHEKLTLEQLLLVIAASKTSFALSFRFDCSAMGVPLTASRC